MSFAHSERSRDWTRTCRLALAAASIAAITLAIPDAAFGLVCKRNWCATPDLDETGVPTNALIWGFGDQADHRLVGPNGEVPTDRYFLPIASGRGAGANLPVLVPKTELEPNTLYWREYEYEASFGGEVETGRMGFQTGSGPALDTPPLPELTWSTQAAIENGWSEGGLDRFQQLEFDHRGILISDTHGALGDFQGAAELLLAQPLDAEAAQISASSRVVRWLTTASTVVAGRGACLLWPEVDDERVPARFGVLDLAGNFSGWQDVELEIPSLEAASALVASTVEAPPRTGPALAPPGTSSACSLTSPRQFNRGGAQLGGLVFAVMLVGARRGQRPGTAPST